MKVGKLGKLKMPPKDAIDMGELEMDMGEEAPESEAPDMEAEKPAAKGGDLLTKVADEDLLAEVKKRGLTAQLSEESPEEMARDKKFGAKEEDVESEEYM